MQNNPFQTRQPSIARNPKVRAPQQETFEALRMHAEEPERDREVGVVLPVGCGKSGCIAIAPFAFKATRTLVVAPGVNIAEQLYDDFAYSRDDRNFYIKCEILNGPPYPEPCPIRGNNTNRSDLDEADVVVTNIQQLQGDENKWLTGLPEDYFDLIIFDEGHHGVAASWTTLKDKFPRAQIVNFSATPLRADGQRMAGRILYTYPVSRAIQEGYVKQLKAIVLNPKTLRYVRVENGEEITVGEDEVRRLGEEDADFRRSIVTSTETLNTIVDASIRELARIRTTTNDSKHKIIASALNFTHCNQIVAAYRARGLRADFVHSKEDSAANTKVMNRLEDHELDVIVQVRKLGEGFDHRYLSVAAIFSIFANLSPFVQFVGRIMRVIKQNAPGDPINSGTVVFHAGSNIARRWTDFQEFSEADKKYFDELLPLEPLDFTSADEIAVDPQLPRAVNSVEVRGQTGVRLDEIPLIEDDDEAMMAIETLKSKGYSIDDVQRAMELKPILTTKVGERQAARAKLDAMIKTEVGRILGSRKINPNGRGLDKRMPDRTNFVVVKSAIDKQCNSHVGHGAGERHDLSRAELGTIEAAFSSLVAAAEAEVFR